MLMGYDESVYAENFRSVYYLTSIHSRRPENFIASDEIAEAWPWKNTKIGIFGHSCPRLRKGGCIPSVRPHPR